VGAAEGAEGEAAPLVAATVAVGSGTAGTDFGAAAGVVPSSVRTTFFPTVPEVAVTAASAPTAAVAAAAVPKVRRRMRRDAASRLSIAACLRAISSIASTVRPGDEERMKPSLEFLVSLPYAATGCGV
jgi:hypothetical protein